MRQRSASIVLYAFAAVLLVAVPSAFAQFTPRSVPGEPGLGEQYHIVEFAAGFWSPDADIQISSSSLGIPGTTIDFKNDLGLTDQKFGELHLTLRPARKQKLRFQYIPINYEQGPVPLPRNIIFNGQLYPTGTQVTSSLDWKAYRFTYEYDFLAHDRWFVGFLLDAKYTNVEAQLSSAATSQFAHAKAPVPAFGGIIRYYPLQYLALTGELTGFKIPDGVSDKYKAHYSDFDINATFDVTKNFGAQLGYRAFNVGYLVDRDSGSFVLKGIYFGGVARY